MGIRIRTAAAALAAAALAVPAGASGRAQSIDYSTYFGGTKDEEISAVAVDGSGFFVVAGLTTSKRLPTANPVQTGADLPTKVPQAFVARFFPDRPDLVFSTYLGGSKGAVATAVAVDDAGFVYVAGATESKDFPRRTPIQRRNAGGTDAFVAKLSPGGALVASTFFGGSGSDVPAAIRVGPDGAVYVAGRTTSADFPATLAPIGSPVSAGGGRAFVAKLDLDTASVGYAVTIGGTGDDAAADLAVDGDGAVTIAGRTTSRDFPVLGALQDEYGGDLDEIRAGDGFVARLDAEGALAYATYLGGSSRDAATGVALGADGTIYVSGTTLSPDFPGAGDDTDPDPADGNDAFVAALRPDGSAFVFSRLFGGDAFDSAVRIALGASGDLLVAGNTRSAGLATADAPRAEPAGGDDDYVARFDATTGELLSATYLGGEFDDDADAVAAAPDGTALVTGVTSSADFPTTSDAFQPSLKKTRSDGFVTRLSF